MSIPKNPSTSSVNTESIARIQHLLKTLDTADLPARQNITIVIGMTGSGKSTLIQLLTANNDHLVSTPASNSTGEYVIVDVGHRAASDDTASRAFLPELLFDPVTKTMYVDYPELDENEDGSDIVAAYFMKKVFEKATNFKILLATSYTSVRIGVSGTDFVQLLTNVSNLFTDVENYLDSVALVVTEVENQRKDKEKQTSGLVPDESIIANIARVLIGVKSSLITSRNNTSLSTTPHKDNSKTSHLILDALVHQNGTDYPKIRISRRLHRPGKLSKIKRLQNGKKLITNMMLNLRYAPIDKSSLKFAISDKSRTLLSDLAFDMNQNIIKNLSHIETILTQHFENLEKSMPNDMYALYDQLKSSFQLLLELTKIGTSAKADLASFLQTNMPGACVLASKTYLGHIHNYSKYLNFIQNLNIEKFDSFVWTWTKQLHGAVAQVKNSLLWYELLIALHRELSRYDVQKNRRSYHTPSLTPNTLGNIPSFFNFFQQIATNESTMNTFQWETIKEITVDAVKIKYFEKLIESTLKNDVIITGISQLKATREFITLAEVTHTFNYKERLESLIIFATNTIFIDVDITQHNQLVIIAPRWEIIGNRVISTNGAPGAPPVLSKAADAFCSGCNGENGAHGNAGESAGSFFGIGYEFVNEQNLLITSIGGQGGSGQHGGHGRDGHDSDSKSLSPLRNRSLTCELDETYRIVFYPKGSRLRETDPEVDIEKRGGPGGKGGDCGRGGAPGLGGYKGDVTLLSTSNRTINSRIQVTQGADGSFGVNGNVGKGGKGRFYSYVEYYFRGKTGLEESNLGESKYMADSRPGNCYNYTPEDLAKNEIHRAPLKKHLNHSPSDLILAYRKELLQNFNNSLNLRYSWDFYESLRNNDTSGYDNIDDIFAEFKELENFHVALNSDIQTKLLLSLSIRLQIIDAATDSASIRLRDRKLLEPLSIAITSKLTSLINYTDPDVVYDHQAYAESTKNTNSTKTCSYSSDDSNNQVEWIKNLTRVVDQNITSKIADSTDQIANLPNDHDAKAAARLLQRYKVFVNLRIVSKFLRLLAVAADRDMRLVRNIRIKEVLPSVQITTATNYDHAVDASIRSMEKLYERELEAIKLATSKERKTLRSLRGEYDSVNDQLLEFEDDPQMRCHSTECRSEDLYHRVEQINDLLSNSTDSRVKEMLKTFNHATNTIKFDANLYLELVSSNGNMELISSVVDGLQYRVFSEHLEVDLFDTILPILHNIRKNNYNDNHNPQNLQNHWTFVSETLIKISHPTAKICGKLQDSNDERSIAENLLKAENLLINIYHHVLRAQYDETLLEKLKSHLDNFEFPNNNVRIFFKTLLENNASRYEYNRQMDTRELHKNDTGSSRDLCNSLLHQSNEKSNSTSRRRRRRNADYSTNSSGKEPSNKNFVTKFSEHSTPEGNYFLNSAKPNLHIKQFQNTHYLESNTQPHENTPRDTFYLNNSLALADLVIRNITKVKAQKYKHKLLTSEEARIAALNILNDFENLLNELPRNESLSSFNAHNFNPIELMSKLETNILSEDLPSIKQTLLDFTPTTLSIDKYFYHKLTTLLHQNLNRTHIRTKDKIGVQKN